MNLKRTQQVWEEFGETDPLFGVLSDKSKRGNIWDVNEFFATGKQDITEAMEYITCAYLVNTVDDLALFDAGVFDFIYTYKVLQHMHPTVSSRYICEFYRVIKPGGIVLFQVPSGQRCKPGSLAEAWYNFKKGPLRAGWKRMRGMLPVEMHNIHYSRVEEIISESGGELIGKRQFGSVRRTRTSYQYCVLGRART